MYTSLKNCLSQKSKNLIKFSLKIDILGRHLHRFPKSTSSPSLKGFIYHEKIRYYTTFPNSTQFDWEKYAADPRQDFSGASPDFLSPEELEAETKKWLDLKEYLKKIPKPDKSLLEHTKSELAARLREIGVPKEIPSGLSERRAEITVQKSQELMEMEMQVGNFDKAVDIFVELRKNGILANLKMYEHLFAIVCMWSDIEASDLLLAEMKEIGFPIGQPIITNLLTKEMYRKNTAKVEEYFQELRNRKYDIPDMIWGYVLSYYAHFTTEFEKTMNFYELMKTEGVVKNADAGNVLLHMCKNNQLFDLADKIYADMEESGLLTSTLQPVKVLTFEGQDYFLCAKEHVATETFRCMFLISCMKYDLEKATIFLQKTRDFIKLTNRKTLVINVEVYEALLDLYDHHGLVDKTKETLEEIQNVGIRVTNSMWKKVFRTVMRTNNIREVLKLVQEFESHGYDYDEELSGELILFYTRVNDLRRAKNTYNSLIEAGISPSIEARSAIIQVYAKAGQPDEVQRFYDDQVRAGIKMTRTMHEVMIDDYLKRGYPGSAKIVLQRMEIDGVPPTPEVICRIAGKYADLGAVRHVKDLLNCYFLGPQAKFSVTSAMLSVAIKACSIVSDSFYALELWEKYSKHIMFSYEFAEEAISSFQKLNAQNTAMDVYERLKRDRPFQSTDSLSLFHTILSKVASPSSCDMILTDMHEAEIPLNIETYITILSNENLGPQLGYMLKIVTQYLKEYYPGPYQVGVLIEFFGAVAKFDFGTYKREARAWINKIVGPPTADTFLIPNENKPEPINPLEPLSPRISLLVSKYILSMDPAKFISPAANKKPIDSLFTGSDVDIADILVHEFGFEESFVNEALGDNQKLSAWKASLPDVSGIMEKIDNLKRIASEK